MAHNFEKYNQLNKEEALAYQDYATKKESIAFSEQAKEESYIEAEMFLKELSEKGINLEGVDFSKIDLSNVVIQEDISERLQYAIWEYVENHKNDKLPENFKQNIEEAKKKGGVGRIAALATAFLILISAVGAGTAEARQPINKEQIKEISILQDRFSPEVKRVVLTELKTIEGKVVFGYDQQGSPVEYRSETRLNINKKTATFLLVENYKEILKSAPILKNQAVDPVIVEKRYESASANLLAEVFIYKEFLNKGKIAEAQWILNDIFKKIADKENKIGGPIFDRDHIKQVLGIQE